MRRRRLLVTCAASVLLAACAGGPDPVVNNDAPPPHSAETTAEGDDDVKVDDACLQAFADAETGEGPQEAALTACADIAAFTAASADYPEVLGEVEAQVWLAEACTETNSNSALCQEVAGELE